MRLRILLTALFFTLTGNLLPVQAQMKLDFKGTDTRLVKDAGFTSDSKYFITAGPGGVKFWTTNGEAKLERKIPMKQVEDAFVLPTRVIVLRKTALFSSKYVLEEVSVPEGKVRTIASFIGQGKIAFIHPDKTGNLITLYMPGKKLLVIDRETGKEKFSLPNPRGLYITDACIAFEGRYMVTTGSNKKVCLYSTKDQQLIADEKLKDWTRTIESSKDGFSLLIGDDAGTITKFTLDEGKLINDGYLETGAGRISRIRFSESERTFVAGTNLGNVLVYSIENTKPLWRGTSKAQTIRAINTSPDGRYLAFAGNLSGKLNFYDYRSASSIGVQKNRIRNLKDQTPPQLAISFPPMPKDLFVTTRENITIKGFAMDDFGVNSINLNGQKVKASSGGDFEVTMKLSLGENVFTLEAEDINANTNIKKFRIVRQDSLPDADLNIVAKNHLLIIGIDKYSSWPQLNNAVYDGNAIKELLQARYGFTEENTTLVINEQATRQGILDAFKKVVESVGVNDNVLVYYSGHGIFDQTFGEGYWIPVNGVTGQVADYIPNSQLLQLIKRINSKHTLLIADACFSGSLFEESSRGYIETVSQLRSRWAITSGRLEYVSDGAAGNHSPFNETILSILTNNTKEAMAVSELLQTLKTEVTNKTQQTPVGNPLKNAGDEGGEFVFRIKK